MYRMKGPRNCRSRFHAPQRFVQQTSDVMCSHKPRSDAGIQIPRLTWSAWPPGRASLERGGGLPPPPPNTPALIRIPTPQHQSPNRISNRQ